MVVVVQGILATAGVRDRILPPRQAERRLDAAYPARPTSAEAQRDDDVVDAEVLWEEVEGATSWPDAPSPFSFARSPADLVRAYGTRPAPGPGRYVYLLA